MKKALILVAAALASITLCSCEMYQPDVESLLSAPLLSDLQNHVDEALRDVVGQNIKLKYPVSGDYRSPYVFFDLDADGEEEALVLYSLENDTDVTYLQILDRADDKWYAGSALPGSGSEVEFVRFSSLLPDGQASILIGWQSSDTDSNFISVYSIEDNKLKRIYETSYTQIALSDFNGDGTQELLIATIAYDDVILQLLGDGSDGSLVVLDGANAQRMSSLLEPVIGEIKAGLPGVVIDGMVSANCMASLLIGIENDHLVLPINDLDLLDPSIGDVTSTFRYTGVRSADINGDGVIEIPLATAAAGYSHDASSQYFTDFSALGENGFQRILTTYENPKNGYRFYLPKAWMTYYDDGVLSVYQQAETREVSFFLYEGTLTEHNQELLRLRVVSTADYLDKFDSQRYILLQKRGQFEYYAHLSAMAELPQLSAGEAAACFSLLG